MNVLKCGNARNLIMNNMKNGALVPIIGSGFTSGCISLNGSVPSGKQYKRYMKSAIEKHLDLSQSDIDDLVHSSFSQTSSLYQKHVPIDDQRKFLQNNFTKVRLSTVQKQFLEIQ